MQIKFCFHLELLPALAKSGAKCILGKRPLLTQPCHENTTCSWSLDLPIAHVNRVQTNNKNKNKNRTKKKEFFMLVYLQ